MMKNTNLVIRGLQVVLLITCACALMMGVFALSSGGAESGSYFSAALSAIVGFGLTLIPSFLVHKDIMVVPAIIQTAFTVFVFCAMFGGDVLSFYNRVSWWDSFLHLSSGILFSVTGYMLFISLNRSPEVRSQLNPVSVIMFTFCFALACGAIWEIFEFAVDCFFGANMQRWQNTIPVEQWAAMQNVTNLSQPGLIDSMKDLTVDTAGAILAIPLLLPMIRRDNRYTKAGITTKELLAIEWQPIPSAAADTLETERH